MLFNPSETTQTPFNEAVAQAMTLAGCGCVQTIALTIPSAQVYTLGVAPYYFGAVVPAGFYIQPIAASFKAIFNSVAYDETWLGVGIAGNGGYSIYEGNYMGFNADTFVQMTIPTSIVNQDPLVDGGDMYLAMLAVPTVGDSDITVTISFLILPTPQ
jgi:hypothetical protein